MLARRKSQAALDFMVSYGIVILVLSIVVFVVAQLGAFNPVLAPTYCNAAPSFACLGASIKANSILTIVLSQASGATMNVVGASCSVLANASTVGPMFGNIGVKPYSTAPQYYPNNALQSGTLLYSSNSLNLTVYCYGGTGLAKGKLGTPFSGTVWLNFTISSLPQTYNNVVEVATFTAKYA